MRVVIERIAFCGAKSAGAKRRQRDGNAAYIPTTVGIPDTLREMLSKSKQINNRARKCADIRVVIVMVTQRISRR